MGVLDRINPFKRHDARSREASWMHIQRDIGLPADARAVENLSTAMACVQAVSGAIAALPAYVYRRDETGRHVEPSHPLQNLIRIGPNQHQSWPDFCEWVVSAVLLRGNVIIEVQRDNIGRLIGLKPLPFDTVLIVLLRNGRMVYDVTERDGQNRQYRLLDTEVIHIKDRSDDGLVGRSRISRAAGAIGLAHQTQDYTNSIIANGISPRSILKFSSHVGQASVEQIKKSLQDRFEGAQNAGRTMVLDVGLEYQALPQITPEDAELLQSRRFNGEEIARIFGVPPAVIGDLTHGTFTNAETAGRWFAQHTLTPWIRKLEAAFTRSVFTEVERQNFEFDIDLSGMLRGDPETRWASHKIAIETGVLDAAEVREIEGWNPRETSGV